LQHLSPANQTQKLGLAFKLFVVKNVSVIPFLNFMSVKGTSINKYATGQATKSTGSQPEETSTYQQQLGAKQ